MIGINLTQYVDFIKQLDEEIQFMKGLDECDKLGQARAVYYCLYMTHGLKEKLGVPVSKTSQRRSSGAMMLQY